MDNKTLYCSNMEEIKRRVALLNSLINNQATLGTEDFDYEVACVNLRKILEIIAFSSLIANKEKYSETFTKFQYEWRIEQLLKNLEKVNPDYYPNPLNPPIIVNHIPQFSNLETGYLNKDDFSTLYNLCNDVLHFWNPFHPRERKIDFILSVAEWTKKIQNLLSIHSIRMVDSSEIWLVYMNSQEDGKVHVLSAI